ncbi:uncharacterized protein LOC119277663 [Triticum dicoccoides]|uniref:uncharacterized protein LOC119277663 n=1 Tax=Triticum dicoccoides TaxID=85692 RepID=UPI00188F6610|nr:uncharacterized protein LOC119277663 [Triticum dicoccoides]
MADPAAAATAPMTIDFLRARLLSERSVSRASKERADQLAARVAELEEQVRAVTAQRRQAEREAAEVLAVLESRGFCGSLSDELDAGSDADEEERDEPSDATATGGDPAPRSHNEQGQEQPPEKGEAEEEEDATSGTALQPGGLSWKGRCASPRRARQLKQRHRRSYVYFLASQSDPWPKYRMGQSCRKNKRKELSSVAAVVAESRKEQRDGPRCADDDGRTEFDGEVGGDDRRSSGDGGGQYVMRRDDGDGEMERVLEKQAELIGQYEAQEKAQTDWEKKFNDTRGSPSKGDVEADCQFQTKSGGEKLLVSRTHKNASEEMARTAAFSAQGSSSYSTATRRSQGDANSDGCSSHYTNSASSSGLGTIKAPSESSPSPSVSKVSDWSSSRFHDNADDNHGNIDVESVLQALQRARISLRQKLDRPLPPSQVTLALPAPGDEYRADLYDDDGNSSYRDEHVGSSPSRQEILALPAPEDYHGYHDRASANCWTDGGADTAPTEKPSPPQQEILALPAPGDDADVKIPVGSPGLFRLPTDSFPKEETLPAISNGHDAELGLIEVEAARHDTYRDGDGAGVLPKQLYDPPTSGRCSVPPGSGFLSGIPGLPEDLRKGGGLLGDADLFISNKWML